MTVQRIVLLGFLMLALVGCDGSDGAKDDGPPDAVSDTVVILPSGEVTEPVEEVAPDICEPQCEGLVCGGDGCGGNCGECEGAQDECLAGLCVCQPDCDDISCGDDGCGGSCGLCGGDQMLCVEGACVCQPECGGMECGSDGCNGTCGKCGGLQDQCIEGACVCQPFCTDKNCGSDGCNGVCGTCEGLQEECLEGVCTCIPACEGLECGEDGCGDLCGTCEEGAVCFTGSCCTPQCDGIECGDNGCGDICGECLGPQDICQEGLCVCIPDCEGKSCGSDGCDGGCGECEVDDVCFDGTCCTPDCLDKLCGDNSCGGFCGNAAPVTEGCAAFETCLPDDLVCETFQAPDVCGEKVCGANGLGGVCGTCPCPECEPSDTKCEAFECMTPLGLECWEMYGCLGDCPEGDQFCQQDCLGDGTPKGTVIFNNLSTCLDESGYFDCPDGDDVCTEESFDQCLDAYYACFHGDEPCNVLYVCIVSCPAGDSNCTSDCFTSATIEALNVWDEFIACLDFNHYFECESGDSDCYDVAWAKCDSEFQACANGDLSCEEVYGCILDCNSWDSACRLGCRVQGTIQVQNSMDDILACEEEYCEPLTGLCEQQVLLDECADTYAACMAL
jgi:hypothetical protein